MNEHPTDYERTVLATLRREAVPLSQRELSEWTRIPAAQVYAALRRLHRTGAVERNDNGYWSLAARNDGSGCVS